jgi:hypothetical protein
MAAVRPIYRVGATTGTCATCGAAVTAIDGRPSRLRLNQATTLYTLFAWCRLVPCGHTFSVPRGGLIH